MNASEERRKDRVTRTEEEEEEEENKWEEESRKTRKRRRYSWRKYGMKAFFEVLQQLAFLEFQLILERRSMLWRYSSVDFNLAVSCNETIFPLGYSGSEYAISVSISGSLKWSFILTSSAT